jgi:hypothetical protein
LFLGVKYISQCTSDIWSPTSVVSILAIFAFEKSVLPFSDVLILAMVPTGCTVVPLFYDVPRGAVQGRDVTSFPVVPSSLLQLTSGHPLDSTYGSSITS